MQHMTQATTQTPTFSIIIPTRDRAALFERTLKSVFEQDLDDYEVIVINDGSTGRELDAYHTIERTYAKQVSFHHLIHRNKGHGPAYSRNFGSASARGQYLCFLDDDDLWIDRSHLRRCRDTIQSYDQLPDLLFTDQKAVYPDGRLHPGRLWISGIEKRLSVAPDGFGNYRITLPTLLLSTGFAHLNCSVFRRQFFDAIGGMDETLRYENDRDVYLRAIDAAQFMLYNPAVIAQHHIPDANKSDNVSTAVSQLEKRIFQLRICDKAILFARQPETRAYARKTKAFTLKLIAETLKASGRHREALFYMREALGTAPSAKWLAYTLASSIQSFFGSHRA
jgi:glycosyltransferase involved in cell wall biosynthesis